MARNTAVRVLDDLTGEPAAETVGFGLDGIDYDIDLSFANAEALRGLLQRYADAGRRTGGRKNRPRAVPGAEQTAPKAAAAKAAATPGRAKATPPAAKAAPAKATPGRTKATPAAGKAAPAKPAPAEGTSVKVASAKAAPAMTKAAATKPAPAKAARAKAEPPKTAEPKATTRAAVRKVPTVTFSAAE
ncbi:histone-like nucleoid-structuring protein Lsr2 [Amycolatopsis mediterranei]|uniref:Lsr2 dimerization domain-containing protein n=1 Tax=Amycolatopsis mediterranei TaxID=33910 RepID=UPI00341218FD